MDVKLIKWVDRYVTIFVTKCTAFYVVSSGLFKIVKMVYAIDVQVHCTYRGVRTEKKNDLKLIGLAYIPAMHPFYFIFHFFFVCYEATFCVVEYKYFYLYSLFGSRYP